MKASDLIKFFEGKQDYEIKLYHHRNVKDENGEIIGRPIGKVFDIGDYVDTDWDGKIIYLRVNEELE